MTKRGFFPYKKNGQSKEKNLAAHLEGAHGTQVEEYCCISAFLNRRGAWYRDLDTFLPGLRSLEKLKIDHKLQ